jgi:HlyD family secretion protein
MMCVLLVLLGGIGTGYWFTRGLPYADAEQQESRNEPERPPAIHVDVVLPKKGGMDRVTTQPGTVQAFESVQLYAGVSGYLKKQDIDIGYRVKKGEVLAEVDVPDLDKQVQRHKAAVEQAVARVEQMEAHITSAEADLEAAKAAVPQAEALAKSKAAALRFREQQLHRMRDLFALKSIDERLVDETTEQRDAAREAEIAAREGVNSARAHLAAAAAKVIQAKADATEARAEVRVAQAELEKAQVMVKFATILAPFDGVITERNFFVHDYVRAAAESGTHLPLFTVQRTDLFRVVVQIPDRDVPYADVGDPATVEIDALPGQKFPAQLSRLAQSEDPQTRLMHVEIDVPNSTGRLRHGMYGRVTILLDHSEMLSLPSSCLVSKTEGKGNVFVVHDGVARLTAVEFGSDNGLLVGILKGLKEGDEVIAHPSAGIGEGSPVIVENDVNEQAHR